MPHLWIVRQGRLWLFWHCAFSGWVSSACFLFSGNRATGWWFQADSWRFFQSETDVCHGLLSFHRAVSLKAGISGWVVYVSRAPDWWRSLFSVYKSLSLVWCGTLPSSGCICAWCAIASGRWHSRWWARIATHRQCRQECSANTGEWWRCGAKWSVRSIRHRCWLLLLGIHILPAVGGCRMPNGWNCL